MSLVDNLLQFAHAIGSEASKLLLSDVAATSVQSLVSQPGLWVRNSLIHAAAGFVVFFWKVYFPRARAPLDWAFNAYLLLQIVQLWSPGEFWALALDGVFDVLIVAAGWSVAWAWSMRAPKGGAL